MKHLLIILLLCFLPLGGAFAEAPVPNLDGIGTFGGDWPFPLEPEADLPENINGMYEVRQAIDGAYFHIGRERNPETLRYETRMDLFDPCTFKPTATGSAYIRKNTVYGTLNYVDSDKKVKVRMKAFEASGPNKSNQMVLMIMKGDTKTVEKYFPVEKIEIEDLVKKCENP